MLLYDGSDYTPVHPYFHPLVKSIVEKFGYYDFYLVDVDTENIVYSELKETDLGSNLNLVCEPLRRFDSLCFSTDQARKFQLGFGG